MFSRVLSGPPTSSQIYSVLSPHLDTSSQKELQPVHRLLQAISIVNASLERPRLRTILTAKTNGFNLYIPGQVNPVVDFARIALKQNLMPLSVYKDNTRKLGLKVVLMAVYDIRPDVKSKFKEIISSARNGQHFQMQLDISTPEPNHKAIAFITLTDPRTVRAKEKIDAEMKKP